MELYRNVSSLKYSSEDESDNEETTGFGFSQKRRNDGDELRFEQKKLKLNFDERQINLEPIGSVQRLSNASSVSSSFGSPSNSEDELSPGFYCKKESPFETALTYNENKASAANNDNQSGLGFSAEAQKIMMKMGYEKGKGLGKFKQGITVPISESKQRGRRGLGFTIKGLEPMENLTWDKSKEHILVKEEVFWLPNYINPPPDLQTLLSWVEEGQKKLDISDETKFCEPHILQQVLSSKSVFDSLPEKELMKARSRSNPFETLGKLFFQNRAALKMANLDAVFDFMFTQPVDENGKSMVGPDELYYFADVCAAPGGFSEYVLWKRKQDSHGFCDAKGFGFTLKENDFRLHDFFAAPAEFFEPHYGVNGIIGTGDIYVPDNISNFRNFVLKQTGGKGIHFMMADGGFSVEGNENIQEILSKRLYLCQFLVALGIVREGGHFVCKLFDIFTPFTVGLIYIMYTCFKQVSIHKPNTSRPANSERYIICKWRKEDVSDAYEYFFKINLLLDENSSTLSKKDILAIVPLEILLEDEEFFQYICDSNNVFGERQVIGLQKIRSFCQDPSLFEDQQAILRKECLTFWRLPDKSRVAPDRRNPQDKARELISPHILERIGQVPGELQPGNIVDKIHSPYDFRFVFLSTAMDSTVMERGFYLGLGGPNIYLWSGKEHNKWHRIGDSLSFPPDTVVYGEIVVELRGELRAQRRVRAMHLIDALMLNGFDVSSLHLVERHAHLKKFAAALNKESRNDLLPIRCKTLYKLEEIDSIVRPPLIDHRIMKGANGAAKRVYREAEAYEDDPVRYTVPTGILLLKITEDPWMMAYSKSQKRKYWFNTHTRESTFDCSKEVIAPLSTSYSQGLFWWWSPGVQILDVETKDTSRLDLRSLIEHINKIR